MKRRLISALLAALILVGLLPSGVLSASADTLMTASDEAITLLKSWEGFLKYPRWDNSQYTIGYGTSCDPDDYPNGITEEQAEVLLREHMATVEASVSSFANKNGITLNQNQFDALVLFSYNVGTAWMSQGNSIREAVIKGMTGNDFIFYLTRWCVSGGGVSTGHIYRRLAEADIYLNGYYAKRAPDCFTYVLFNGNGNGSVYTYNVQGYKATEPVEVKATAVLDGSKFLGWYTAKDGGRWVTTLDSTTKAQTLYAHWQVGDGNVDENGKILGTPADYARIAKTALKVYTAPSASAQLVTTVGANAQVVITADYVDAAGVKWGKLESGNWVNLTDTGSIIIPDAAPDRSNSVTLGSGSNNDSAEDTAVGVPVKVTASSVNFRNGPGTKYTKLGTLSYGQQLIITEVEEADDMLWGKFSYGWLSLMYTNYDEVIQNGNTGNNVIATGTVVSTDALRIRSGAGTNHAVVGALNSGAKVKIYEIVYNGKTPWGRIATGWICLTYVDYTMGSTQAPEENPKPEDTTAGTPVDIYGWVTAVALNVREGAGASYDIVARLSKDDYVHVTELKNIGGAKWGKVEQGWISMDFILVDEKNSDTDPDVIVPEQGQQPGGNQPGTDSGNGQLTGVVKASNLCVRSAPGTNSTIVTTIPNGTAVTILQQTLVNGVVWGQIEQGWICMTYVTITSSGNVAVCTGMITASTLCIRTAAGTGNAIAGTYSRGELVQILEVTTVKGTQWGRTDKGWISMDYVQVTMNPVPVPPVPETPVVPSEPTVPEQPETPETPETPEIPENPEQGVTGQYAKGVVTASNLCVRSTPGMNGAIVTTISNGTEVTILQQTLIDGVVWGQIENGWICMTYVKVTSAGNVPVCTGMVTASQLTIRSAAGTTNAIVGSYMRGDVVQILEITQINKTYWGRTDKGWICMDYVQTSIAPDVNDQPGTGTVTPETPDNGGNTETPDNGGNTETPDNGGNTETPDNGGNTETPDNGGNTETPDDGENTPSNPGVDSNGAFAFTAEECVAAINAAIASEQAKIVARGNENGVLTYELVDTLDEGSLGVAVRLELAEDGRHVAGIVLVCDANDEDASNILYALSVMAMSMLDSSITDADLEQMVSGDPETDEEGVMYYIMERDSGVYAYILDTAASSLYFCVYPAA